MVELLILLHLVKIPFPTGPIARESFPGVMETLTDTSSALDSRSPYVWASDHEMIESLEVASGAYSVSSWI